jgi:glycosyltransferase involved in cell wall biosynthesis
MRQPQVLLPTSVVICTRDRPETLAQTLESVLAQTYDQFEVMVVDQSRGEETAQLVAQMAGERPCLRYLRLHRPGLSRAYNAGIEATDGQLLAFTDDDVVVPRDWLGNIARAFAAHPQVRLLYGQVLLPPELAERESLEGVTPALPIAHRRILDRRHGFRVFGMGANFAARRELFSRIGGFDEVLGGGGPLQSSQDFDFVYRAFRAGESTLLEPEVVAYHYGFRSYAGEWQATMRSYGVGVGGFYSKHVRAGDAYAAWLLLGILTGGTARIVKRLLTREPARPNLTFLANVLAGVGRSFGFPVDRRLRLYRAEP